MSKRETLLTTSADLPLNPVEGRPLFIVLAGRGGTGKSFLVRWICERTFAAGRSVVIADGDRTNRALPRFFDDVQAPTSSDDRVVRRWLETIIEQMVVGRFSVVIDLGGGDMVLKQLALELDLQAMLEEQGVSPIILHLIGPEVESLGYLDSVEAVDFASPSGKPLFAPEQTALILNEGLVAEDLDPAEVFAPIRENKVFKAAVRRNAQTILMPRLKPAYEVNRRHIAFADASNGHTKEGLPPLGITDRQRVRMWLRAMDAAFAPLTTWLP
jgi:hypothetical protein